MGTAVSSHERLQQVLYNFSSYGNPCCGGKKHRNWGQILPRSHSNTEEIPSLGVCFKHWIVYQLSLIVSVIVFGIPMPALTTCPLQSREMENHRYSLWNTSLHFLPLWHMAICFLLSLWQSCAILHLPTVPPSHGHGHPVPSPCKSGANTCAAPHLHSWSHSRTSNPMGFIFFRETVCGWWHRGLCCCCSFS